jgi:hypothetical protein
MPFQTKMKQVEHCPGGRKMRHRWNHWLFGRTALAAAALGSFLFFSSVPQLRADNDDCQRRIARADHKLHEAIAHHGYQSKQAERGRHELHEARERCWNASHRWWNEHEHRWHTDQDWDDHDHDHDGDHH